MREAGLVEHARIRSVPEELDLGLAIDAWYQIVDSNILPEDGDAHF
jgi:hypothetical protein